MALMKIGNITLDRISAVLFIIAILLFAVFFLFIDQAIILIIAFALFIIGASKPFWRSIAKFFK